MIRFGKYVAFEITPGLCAFESNRLMEVAAELDKLEIVKIPLAVSSDGSEKTPLGPISDFDGDPCRQSVVGRL